MAAGTDTKFENQQSDLDQTQEEKLESGNRFRKEVFANESTKGNSSSSDSPDVVELTQKPKASGTLPSLDLIYKTAGDGPIVLPWDGSHLHMNYQLSKDAIVRIGEGPHHVAARLLGKDALDSDVKALTTALKEQYIDEKNGDPDALSSIRIGHGLISERNVAQVLSRIPDLAARQRIIDKLVVGWNEKDPPVPVAFDGRGRPGETRPSRMDDPDQFLKDIAAAAIEVGADKLRAKGKCAQGARLAFNQLPLWHIEGGTVDKSINKDPNGWRSGITLAKDLGETGLFDVIPLKEFGYKNLKEGHILGRYHYPDYVKDHPSWDGEDFGDIDIVTKRHRPQNDDTKMYHSSFVLVPKRTKS